MKASDFHNLYGDVVSLDVFAELQELDLTAVQDVRFGDSYVGTFALNLIKGHSFSPIEI